MGNGWRWVSGTEKPPTPTITVEENPEVGRLHGPDGRLLKVVRAKVEHPIGFQPDRDEHTELEGIHG